MEELKVVIFDFDGVLCHDRFYKKTLLPKYSKVYDWIQENIFADWELVNHWMRGEISSKDINKLVSKNTGIEYNKLTKLYEESVQQMQLDPDLLKLAAKFKKLGCKVGIITGNMDVFSEITVPNYKLDEKFDFIINSADYGMLKDEKNGQIFDIALKNVGEEIENSLLIDDSAKTIKLFKQKGGHGHVYKNFEELKTFLGEL